MNPVALESLILEKYQFVIQNAICAPENIRIHSFLDILADQTVIRLNAVIAGESLKKVYKVYPSNWKEALKDRFLPIFLRKYFPVKYDVVDVEAAALYPKFVLPESQYGPVKIAVMDRSYSIYEPEIDE